MSTNPCATANPCLDQAISPLPDQNIELQHEQSLDIEALNLNPHDSATSVKSSPTAAHSEDVTTQPDQTHKFAPLEGVNEELLVRSPNALRMEARTLVRLIAIIGVNDDEQSTVHRNINARLVAIEERLRQLVSANNDDIPLMNEEELQVEGLRLMVIAQGDEDGRALSDEDASAINRRSNAINARLGQLRLSPSENDHEGTPDLQLMSLSDLDEEEERLIENFQVKVNENHSHEDLDGIQRRHREVLRRQREVTRFPSDSNEEILGEDQIQNIILNGGNLPRFLFRGSNSKSGGNESESEPSSSDDADSNSVKSQTVRMINEKDRVVPHAHFADPTMLSHPRRQEFKALREAADWHTSARRFNTPFTSWSCNFETALYFAIGHYPNDHEIQALQEAGLRSDWVFHDADVAADITVVDTCTIPDRHLRVFHQPALRLHPDAPDIQTEFLIYGALDRADGVNLRGVSVQELRASLSCPTWPHCLSRNQLPHQPTLQDISEAWTIARVFLMQQQDNNVNSNRGGEREEAKEEAVQANNIDLGLAVLAGELARQQWAGFPPRPDAHYIEQQVQIQWPEAWMRRIRRYLKRTIFALGRPLGLRLSGIPLANAGTPYVGFPQFRLMQQLLLSWVMDYPRDLMSENCDDDEEEEEKAHFVVLPRHSCDNPALLDTLTDLQLATFQSQMVERDRDGSVPVPPPREYISNRSVSLPSTKDRSPTEEPEDDVTTEGDTIEESNTGDVSVENSPTENASAGSSPAEDVLDEEDHVPGVEPSADAATQTQEVLQQQQTQTDEDVESVLSEVLEKPGEYWPQDIQDPLGLRGGGYQERGEEVPFTFWRFLIFIIACLVTVFYFVLALAVY